jgi:hypothetical protein
MDYMGKRERGGVGLCELRAVGKFCCVRHVKSTSSHACVATTY